MVTYIDISLTTNNILAAHHFIADKREHTEHPTPGFHKEVSNGYCMLPEKCRKDNARKKKQHEHGKHQKHPKDVKAGKE